MSSGCDIPVIIEMLRNLALTAAGLVGAYVGLKGLSSWRQQKYWELDNVLAEELSLGATCVFSSITSLIEILKVNEEDVLGDIGGSTTENKKAYTKILESRIEQGLKTLNEQLDPFKSSLMKASIVWANPELIDAGTNLISEAIVVRTKVDAYYTLLGLDERGGEDFHVQISALNRICSFAQGSPEAAQREFVDLYEAFLSNLKPKFERPS